MKIKYKTSSWGDNRIGKVEFTKETSKTVTIVEKWNGESSARRVSKLTDDTGYFDTFDEAKNYLIGQAERDLECAKQTVNRKRSSLELVKGLKAMTPAGAKKWAEVILWNGVSVIYGGIWEIQTKCGRVFRKDLGKHAGLGFYTLLMIARNLEVGPQEAYKIAEGSKFFRVDSLHGEPVREVLTGEEGV